MPLIEVEPGLAYAAVQGVAQAPGASQAEHAREDGYRVLRGGSWRINAQAIRLSSRFGLSSRGRYSYVSFRLVRALAARDEAGP